MNALRRTSHPGCAALVLLLASFRTARGAPEDDFAPDAAKLTLHGEMRQRYEFYRNALWGLGPQDDDGYWLQRYMLRADVSGASRWRILAELKSGIEQGRNGGPRPTDEDQLDWHQALIDLRWKGTETFTLRTGRQELAFGSSRLVSVRESPNVRLSFDGVRGTVESTTWRTDVFAVRPVETDPGTFDDAGDRSRALWGVYTVADCPLLPGGKVDLYYLGLRRDRATFNQGTAREERHSIGVRLWGRHANWDYNCEFVGQFGEFGTGSIRAWTAASDTGYSWSQLSFKPRLGLKANVSSGDRDPARAGLETFNALFPRGAYFSESALIGPANLLDLHPGISVQPARTLTVSLDWDFFWRESVDDGLYGPSVNLVRPARTSTASAVGHQPGLSATWLPASHWTVSLACSRFFAGPFLRETGPAEDADYFSTWLTFRF